MAFSLKNLTGLVSVAIQHNASDIHLREGESPCLRIRGELVPVQTKNFSSEDITDILNIMNDGNDTAVHFDQLKDLDGGYTLSNICRIRFNYFKYNEKHGIILRIVRNEVPSIEELRLSKVLKEISLYNRGLVLVTGATGSGKSTTLAAMINHINQNKTSHIVTIEDPIEYIHPQIKSRITQREIGTDTDDFTTGLRSALRQDPDVILIGEMRDIETVQTALKAAETGHLVMATVHTTNAVSTLGRIISMFPTEEHVEISKRLAENLRCTISQRMLKDLQGKGVIIAQEIMINGPGIQECIRGEESLSRMLQIIKENYGPAGNGSQSFDQHIMSLYKNGLITKETALESAENESDFIQNLNFSN